MNSQEYFIEEARKNVPVNMEKARSPSEFYALLRKTVPRQADLWPEINEAVFLNSPV
jgi:hypothetical protein